MTGTRIGQYRVLQLLGVGGMGRVLLCEHAVIGTRHAVKMLHDEFSKNEMVVQRFLNEARAASAIGHRNVVEITHADQVDGQGPWYLVMKYLTGQTLSAFLASRTAPPDQRLIVHVIGEALNGLQAAHDRRIIHRDLKPDNLFLTSTKDDPIRTILLDFGIAQLGQDAGVVTRTGSVIGTPQYMAPEQHRAGHIDHRADLWAIGAIVYEMATGRLPYQDDGEPRDKLTGAEIFYRMMSRPLVDPRGYNPTLTEHFVEATMTALELDPARRPASARAAALAWAEATPGDADAPSGIEILKTYAEELLQGDNLLETMRSPPPSMDVVSRYEIGARLGQGGMAEVFLATVRGVEGFARPVALKRVLTGFSEQPLFAAMFIEEARIAMRLVHENVVSVIDFSRDEAGRFFLVMEYVAGKDLSAIIETGALPPSVAVFVAVKMLRGLGYAHELPLRATNTRGVIHRDVSPQNVLISWQGAVKVSDFGLAKARDATGAVRSLMLKGKPSYMSPEQANSEPLDPRSDLFAVGVVLSEMLSGRRLFEGEKEAVFTKIFFGKNPSLRSMGVRVSSRLDRVVSKLLARDRGARYPSAARALDALTSCPEHPRDGESELVRLLAARFPSEAQTLPLHAPQPRVAAQIAARHSPMSTLGATASQSIPAVQPPRARRAWLLAPVVLVGVAIATALLSRPGNTGEPAQRPQAADAPSFSQARMPARAPEPSVTVAASAPSDPRGSVDGGAPTAATAPKAPDAAAAAPTPAVAASVKEPSPAATSRIAHAPVDAGVPDAAVIAAPQPPTAHESPAADPGSSAPGAVPVGTGRLKIVILPWAEAWLDGKPLGQTPIVGLKVAAGVHRIRLKNDNKEKTVTVTVTTSKLTVIDETW